MVNLLSFVFQLLHFPSCVGRGVTDQCKSLWSSWVVRTTTASVYFGGDTGYTGCPAFLEIGERYGPFDVAMIPIWRGASLSILGRLGLRVCLQVHVTRHHPFILFKLTDPATSLLSTLHATPSDAVQLYQDIKAKRAIAMHFGTFCGSEDEAKEPLELLVRDLEMRGISLLREIWENDGFGYVDVGGTVLIPE